MPFHQVNYPVLDEAGHLGGQLVFGRKREGGLGARGGGILCCRREGRRRAACGRNARYVSAAIRGCFRRRLACRRASHPPVHSFIRESVGLLVFAAEHMLHLEPGELSDASLGFLMQRLEVGAFNAVLAFDLLHHELGIGDDPESFSVVVERPGKGCEQASIFRDIVRFYAEKLGKFGKGRACFILDKNAVAGGAWITARAAVAKSRDTA